MASPLALAPLLLAERHLDQGHRLSGLGGEVARGFYYAGEPADATTTPAAVQRLARWRLFANEAVAADALDPDFTAAARTDALAALCRVFARYARDSWLTATDEFFLYQRTQRWGGAHGTVAATARTFVNPMFDRRFLALALAADPDDKRHSRLYARLMCRLDPGLARIPLDSGAVPARLAAPGPFGALAGAALTGRRAVRKVRQRLTGGRRPQLGAPGLARLVVAHWRAEPDTVGALRGYGFVRAGWLDEVLDGRREPPPTTVAFLVNLLAMAQAAAPAGVPQAAAAPLPAPGPSSG
jgi:asparagine synthase (glutamine-hydrolysing)